MENKGSKTRERRRLKRFHLSYYMPVLDPDTLHVVGHLVDLNKIGLLLDSLVPLGIGKEFQLRIDTTPEISDKGFIQFTARVKWCRMDKIQPNIFNVGFEITGVSAADSDTIQSIVDHFGTH